MRNVATLGGNVAHALPAADGTIALMCLDCRSRSGWSAGQSPRAHCLNCSSARANLPCKLARSSSVFTLPRSKPGQASCFKRIMRPQGVALAHHQLLRLARTGRRYDQRYPHRSGTGRRGAFPRPQGGNLPGRQALLPTKPLRPRWKLGRQKSNSAPAPCVPHQSIVIIWWVRC